MGDRTVVVGLGLGAAIGMAMAESMRMEMPRYERRSWFQEPRFVPIRPPAPMVIVHPASVPPLPLDKVAEFLELSTRSPGLSRRARRRRRGKRNAILAQLERSS